MYIKSLRVRNYASHADTLLSDLTPVTVLVGPNGGGKSSLFEAIRTLSRILTFPVGRAFGPPPYSFEDKVYRGASSKVMGFEADLVDPRFPATVSYKIELGNSGVENVGSPPSILQEIVELDGNVVFDRSSHILDVPGVVWSDITSGISLFATIRHLRPFQGQMVLAALVRRTGSVVNYRLEPRQLCRPSQEPEEGSFIRMGYEGDNLAACLYGLRENHPDVLDRIVRDIQSVVPKFHGISLNTVGVDRIGYSIEYGDARHRVLAPNTSSGTLLILGLVTLLNVPTQPAIACLEEPETGLTPDAVRLFFQLLCDAVNADHGRPRSQFLFSSHSPFVLVDAWNSLAEDRSFIKRLHVVDGRTDLEDVQSIIDRGDSGAVLQKSKGGRTIMGLKTAEELMCGRFLPSNE